MFPIVHWLGPKEPGTYVVVFTEYGPHSGKSSVYFKVLSGAAVYSDTGEALFEREGAMSSEGFADVSGAEPYASGSIKWDGCMHIDYGRGGYIHFCSAKDARSLGEAIGKVWALARPLFERPYYDD